MYVKYVGNIRIKSILLLSKKYMYIKYSALVLQPVRTITLQILSETMY